MGVLLKPVCRSACIFQSVIQAGLTGVLFLYALFPTVFENKYLSQLLYINWDVSYTEHYLIVVNILTCLPHLLVSCCGTKKRIYLTLGIVSLFVFEVHLALFLVLSLIRLVMENYATHDKITAACLAVALLVEIHIMWLVAVTLKTRQRECSALHRVRLVSNNPTKPVVAKTFNRRRCRSYNNSLSPPAAEYAPT